jgi:ABC-type phosphate transport system ATPase subunit
MSKQQTSVEWLIEEIHKNMGVWIPTHIQEQAKAMEKQQIMNAAPNI